MGNRKTKISDGAVTNYTYNALNQLVNENDITYAYDANGSQVSQQGLAKTADYTYDQEGRLINAVVTTGGTTTIEKYRYNWTGIRTAKITDGVETKYLIDPNGSLSQVIAELDNAGNLLTFYTRGAELISLKRPGETRYYQYDPNGSVRLLTDGTGAVTDTYTYDAFGNLLAKTGTTVNSFLYSGEQFDANTGFYYLRARYMNPSTGTFISMDPAQGSIFDPVSLHKYLYANANPVMNSDPSGRSTLIDEMGTIGIIDILAAACVATVIVGLAILAGLQQNGSASIDMQSIINGLCDQDIIGNLSINMMVAVRNAILANINAQIMNWVNNNTADTNADSDTNTNNDTNTDNGGPEDKKPDKPSKMQKEVEKGQAPREVDRVDPAHQTGQPNQKPHVHFKDKTALNIDGTPHHGTPNPSSQTIEWLLGHGWTI